MSQTLWGKIDRANNSPMFTPAQVGTQANKGTANTDNRDTLFGNTTANAFTRTAAHTSGVITGVYGVSVAEMSDTDIGQVATVTVTAPGSGFTVRPTISLAGGGATTNVATATATAKLVAVSVGSASGVGYVPGDILTVDGGTASVASNVNVTSVGTIAGQTQASFNNSTANGTFAVGSKYSPGVITTLSDGTRVTVAGISTIAAQNTGSFNNATANGTFFGGNNYVTNAAITLNDGTVVNAITVAANVVTAFTITSASVTANVTNNPVLTQASVSPGTGNGFTLTLGNNNQQIKTFAITTATTINNTSNNPTLTQNVVSAGVGAGFTLTLGNNNQTMHRVAIKTAGVYTAVPVTLDENVPTGGTGTGGKLDLSYGLNTVTVTANGAGYRVAPPVVIGGAGGVGATATAALRSEQNKVTSAGWVLRTQRPNGRVNYETLVAMKSISGDTAGDDVLLPEGS